MSSQIVIQHDVRDHIRPPYNQPIGTQFNTFHRWSAPDLPWTPDCAGGDGHLLNLESCYEDG